MEETYLLDQTFENIDFRQQGLGKGEYENCTFRDCNFEYQNLGSVSKVVDVELSF